jgi:hypothetical protein
VPGWHRSPSWRAEQPFLPRSGSSEDGDEGHRPTATRRCLQAWQRTSQHCAAGDSGVQAARNQQVAFSPRDHEFQQTRGIQNERIGAIASGAPVPDYAACQTKNPDHTQRAMGRDASRGLLEYEIASTVRLRRSCSRFERCKSRTNRCASGLGAVCQRVTSGSWGGEEVMKHLQNRA